VFGVLDLHRLGYFAVFQAESGDDILDGVDGERSHFLCLIGEVLASRAFVINQFCQGTEDVPGDL
jgi:hypothetical protein